jgi:ribonuclease HI
MSNPAHLTINIDGAARGNPGPAAFAYVISRDGAPAVEEAGCLGSATNNVAEYTALVRALERAAQLGAKHVVIRSDSELLVKQMNGAYRVKNEQLRALFEQAKRLCESFASVTVRHVPRAQNGRADQLCNEVLDQRRGPVPPPNEQPATPRRREAEAQMTAYLREAASAWARGNPAEPSPEEVCRGLWQILAKHNVLRLPPPR